MPDASSTTCTEYPRRPQRPHSRDRSKRLSDEIRQQELLERFRGPLKVAFVTTACFVSSLLLKFSFGDGRSRCSNVSENHVKLTDNTAYESIEEIICGFIRSVGMIS